MSMHLVKARIQCSDLAPKIIENLGSASKLQAQHVFFISKEYIAKKWCCFSKKTHFRYEKLIFSQKEPHIRIPHDHFSNAEKNFIENGRKTTKLEAFFERPSLIKPNTKI